MKGIVVKSTGSWYHVKTHESAIIECRTAGKLKLDDKKLTNPIAVGDEVDFEMESDAGGNKGIIKHIAPRRNYVVRQSPRKKHQLHLLASNIDQALLIVTMREPNLKLGFIDRFLIMTEPYSIPVIIVFNKYDLYSDDEISHYSILNELYTKIGHRVIHTSTITLEGINELSTLLKDKTTMVAGQSGVGKSTLVNCIEPDLNLKTEEISDFSEKVNILRLSHKCMICPEVAASLIHPVSNLYLSRTLKLWMCHIILENSSKFPRSADFQTAHIGMRRVVR